MNVVERNRRAWNRESTAGSPWCTPVDAATIRAARGGTWSIVLTPTRPVPRAWFGDLHGRQVLCLASGGGQQAPILAAAGASVVSFDVAEEQLAKDRAVAARDGLEIECVRGDMSDLSVFHDERFDIVFHPVANLFVPDVAVVWRECFRVLKRGGVLLAGFMNPAYFLFDHDEALRTGELVVRHALPHATPEPVGACGDGDRRDAAAADGDMAEFSHSLEAQLGGQLDAGFAITSLYEDRWSDEATPLGRFAPVAMATRAVKPERGVA